MHTILGAGGPVSNALTKELLTNGNTVKLVSRKPVTIFSGAQWVQADLKDRRQVLASVKGSSVIYITAGLTYNRKIWAAEWPLIMENLLAAAKETGARLIFFDNVYMYGRVKGAMTEQTPYNPSSVKGEIRARIAERLMEESKRGNINATIARGADFYGAESMNSFFDSMVLQKLAKKEKALWLGNPSARHAFTYVPDAGKAMYLLGQTPSSGGQVWHMPTAPALTGRQFLEMTAAAVNAPLKYMVVNKLMLQAMGLFNPLIREAVEMYYQYRHDYIFDSSKFENAFGFTPTSYHDGLRQEATYYHTQASRPAHSLA